MYKKLLLIFCLAFAVTFTQAQTTTKSRSAKTGKFVTKDYARKHKATTYTSKTKNTSTRRRKP